MLNKKAENLIQKYCTALAQQAGVSDVTRQFSLSDPMDTRLREAILHSTEFLQMITCFDVDQLAGQVVVTGTSQLLTGRTAGGRFIRKLGVTGNKYALSETDSCAALDWATLSVWANSGDEGEFFRLMQSFIDKQFALDMLRIGFNGTSVAPTSDPVVNPNGEDVNKGWHQIAKEWNGGSQVLTTPVTLGPGGSYETLDAMASDLVNHLPVECRNDPDIVILVGSDLLAREQFRLYSKADTPTENLAAAQLDTIIAGKKAFVPPFMPGKRIVATTLKNLHIYTQKGSRRRAVEDVQDRKQFENKYWRNEGYALEVPELYVSIDESAISFV
ncbi:phage major capsid protein, P2 family [Gilliamella sp. WF3-4]|uniref:phage major capsid protein, P2 family n=1 Tax=Gilliamella sp. WF3-4 TaxID=3120255 RepID=UPI00080E2D06|nr:phage major capsid protein, P2 family [Gilliamella apicola]OCG19635.1 phage major capsid protein, P2 family [Gilliamella apicola]